MRQIIRLKLKQIQDRVAQNHKATFRYDDKVIDVARSVCERLVRLSPTAVRWTKYALNNWLRAAGPAFDASLALEFMGFTGPDVREGVAALREKRRPSFKPQSPY